MRMRSGQLKKTVEDWFSGLAAGIQKLVTRNGK
jgi:hypothetical protein